MNKPWSFFDLQPGDLLRVNSDPSILLHKIVIEPIVNDFDKLVMGGTCKFHMNWDGPNKAWKKDSVAMCISKPFTIASLRRGEWTGDSYHCIEVVYDECVWHYLTPTTNDDPIEKKFIVKI